MLQVALFALSVFLLIIAFTLYLKLKKLQSASSSSHASLAEETLFHAIPLPIVYRKNAQWHTNKAFNHAFGTMSKENAELLSTLPKNSEQLHELCFDNGIEKHALIYTAPFLDISNDFMAIVVEIEPLHKSKMLLLQQKERFELALEGANEGLWDWDMKSDIIFYSPKWKHIMGYDANENPSTLSSWLNLVHPKDMALVNERLKEHIDGKSDFLVVEHRIRASEPLRWVSIRARIVRGKNDYAIRMVGTIRDITQNKTDEIKASLHNERFSAFMEHIPALAFIKNAQGKYLHINQAYQHFIGFKTWHHKKPADFFDEQTARIIAETDRLSLYEGVVEHDITLPTIEGMSHHFHLFKFTIDHENEKLLCGVGINKSFKE